MTSKDRRTPRTPERLRTLLDEGDHRAARAAARALLSDPAASGAERAGAAAVLASLAPDRGAVVAGVVGIAAALVISAWTIMAG